MTYGIEMLLFISPPYVVGELIGISIVVFFAENYLFTKVMKLGIENKELRRGVSWGLVLVLLCASKLFIFYFG